MVYQMAHGLLARKHNKSMGTLFGGSMRIGDLVTTTDIDDDIGVVVGHHTDVDGTIYNKVKWLNGFWVGQTLHIETECLEVICE